MAICEYHGRYTPSECNDWQCPKCAKEVFDYGQWRTGKKKITNDAKNILKRAGVI